MTRSARPNGPKGFPIFGHFRAFRRQPAQFLVDVAARFGDLAYFQLGSQHMHLINRPELIDQVLVAGSASFMKSRILQRAKVLLGEGLLTSEGQTHLRQRRLLQPAFHRDRLVRYASDMTACADRAQAEWKDGEVRDIAQEMMQVTLDVVGRTLFSTPILRNASEIGAALTAVLGTFHTMTLPFAGFISRLPLPAMRKARRARLFLDQTIYAMIAERRASGVDHGDLLSMLLSSVDEDKTGMSDEQVRDEAMTLFLAGHETTATALTWTFYLLSQNPQVEARLIEEINSVLCGRIPTYEDVARLPYAERVVAESIRIYPPVWAMARMATKPFRLDKVDLRPGDIVIMSPYVMHRNPLFYPDAERFDPDRFLPELRASRPRFSYFPFGGGSRTCIGERFAWMEAVLILSTILQRWRLRLVPGHVVEPHPQITLRTRYGLPMTLSAR
jgi:cytochrome P450